MPEEENPLITLAAYLFIAGIIFTIIKIISKIMEWSSDWYSANTYGGVLSSSQTRDPKYLSKVIENAYDKDLLTEEVLERGFKLKHELKEKGSVTPAYYELCAVLEFAKGDTQAASAMLLNSYRKPNFDGFVTSLGQTWQQKEGYSNKKMIQLEQTYQAADFNYWYILPYLLFTCAGFALIAILPIDSFAFYMFLRALLFVGFLSVLFLGLDHLKEMASFVVSIIGAWLWNPFFINEFDKSIWVVFDLVATGLFIYWGWTILLSIKEDERLVAERTSQQTK